MRIFKLILKTFGILFLVIIVTGLAKMKTIKRLQQTMQLFNEDVIVHNFQNMDGIFKVSNWGPSKVPFRFPKNISYELPETFSVSDSIYNLEEYLDYSNSEGILIIHKDTVVFEEYYRGLTENTTHISWSVAKSVVSALLGIAHDNDLFELDEPITKYLPELIGTGYDGVRIKDILQMSSGVRFDEDYSDLQSDINRFGRSFAIGSSFDKFAKSLVNERKPGTYCHYVSIDTQVLGMLLKKLTNQTLTNYLKEQLWEPMGMQDEGQWIIDNKGMELALGGLNLTLRDYAKFGQLFLNEGEFNGKQLISKEWVMASVTPDAPHLMPGDNGLSSHNYGYGYQWWIPEVDEGDFFASGIYNQYIYVQPKNDLVIVKLSANHHYKHHGQETKKAHVSLMKEIANEFTIEGDSL